MRDHCKSFTADDCLLNFFPLHHAVIDKRAWVHVDPYVLTRVYRASPPLISASPDHESTVQGGADSDNHIASYCDDIGSTLLWHKLVCAEENSFSMLGQIR